MSTQYTFQADIKELLQLIVNSLYSNPDIFLRELLSNSSDAIEKQKHYDLQNGIVGEEYKIRIYTLDDKLYIEDNGVGMSREDLQQQLSTIAKSGTKEFIKQFVDKKNDQIGQFGVGFFSVFLVSDNVVVYSKKKENVNWYRWESDATEHYSIEDLEEFVNEDLSSHGTLIELHLKEDMKDYLKEEKIRSIVKKHSSFIYYPILLKTWKKEKVVKEKVEEECIEEVDEEGRVDEDGQIEEVDVQNQKEEKEEFIEKVVWEQLNGEDPLWYKNPKDLSFEDYNKLYKVLKEPYNDCLFYRHFKTEGNLDMRGILYIPSQAPFDFMQQQTKESRDIKLYVKKVLVLNALDKTMLSDWMGFVSGVIDCPDLPMNVSREVLQESSLLRTIKNQLKKQTLTMLHDLKADTEKYNLFYKNFSKSIKLGIHEGEDKLLDYLKFSITNDPDDISCDLDTFLSSKLVEGQDKIYYMIGNTSPLLPMYEQKGYSIIRLHEPIDEFMMQRVTKYRDFEFINIGKEHDVPWKSEQTSLTEEDEKFATWLKDSLHVEHVDKINLSDTYLENDIGCIVSSKFGMTGNMERIMKSQPMNDNKMMGFMKGKQIWELNINHPLLKQLREKYDSSPDDKPTTLLNTLYQCCLLTSGYSIENPTEFVQSVLPKLSVV